MAVVVEGKGKFAGKKLYLNVRKNKRTGAELYYFSPHKDHIVDEIPKGRKVKYQTSGNLKGYPYLGK